MNKKQLCENIMRNVKQSLNELSSATMGSAYKQAHLQRRDTQSGNIIRSAADKFTKQYGFNIDNYSFSVARRGQELVVRIDDLKNHNSFDLAVKNGHLKYYSDMSPIEPTELGWVVDNLKAGPRAKFRNMIKEVEEFNRGRIDESYHPINESRDGWNDDDDDLYELMEVLEEIYNLQYELKHCVRGAYTNCETYAEIGEHIQRLGERLIEQGEYIVRKPEPIEDEDE